MNSTFEQFQEDEQNQEDLEFKYIEQLEYHYPTTFWEISNSNFQKWASAKYYPKLIEHLNVNLTDFDEWQRTWFMSSEKIISLGIYNCIGLKGNKRNPYKYIIKATGNDSNYNFVSNKNVDGLVKEGGPYFTEYYTKIESFISYFDWIHIRGKRSSLKVKYDDLLYQYQFIEPNMPWIRVKILNNFEILKMGGILIPINKFAMLNTKRVEYANLSNSIFEGSMPTAGHPMEIENSFCYNMIFDNCELSIVNFYKCRIQNLKIANSKIQQWNFIDCEISGEIRESELTRVNFIRGSFNLIIKDCKLYEVEGTSDDYLNNFSDCFKALKTAYGSQGDDNKSIEYYIKERNYNRKKSFAFILYEISNFYIEHKKFKSIKYNYLNLKHICKNILNTLFDWLNYYYWGYGRKPIFVLRISIYVIIFFGLVFYFELIGWNLKNLNFNAISIALSTSASSFSTLGYFTDEVKDINEYLIIIESLIGALNIGAFIGSLANQKY